MLVLQLFLAAFIGIPLALVLIGILLHRRERSALVAAVRVLPCPVCRGELSELSLKAADELWRRHFAAIVEQSPDVKLRIVRRLDAVCEACAARLWFDQTARSFEAMDMVLAFETEADTTIDSRR